jgi:thiol-disulfide isomerase/thioredoxin
MLKRKPIAIGSILVAAIAIALMILSRSNGQSATTQPALTISPEAREILSQVRDAYASLKSLAVSGSMEGRFDIDGVQSTDRGEFNGLYASSGLFRSEMKKSAVSNDPAATTQPSVDALLGNTGEKIYFFLPDRNRYLLLDKPSGKTDLAALGDDVADVIRNQNLSLALALAGDAASELSQSASTILRVEDQKIDGQSYPTISILSPRNDMTLSIDPQTHLLRRETVDLTKNATLMGAKVVKSAALTIDYNNVPAAPAVPAAFAWSPPPGAQLLAADNSGPGADAGADIENKPAPPFSLFGLDGQQVSSKSLLGSVYVLDFWATWCGPCVASLPHMDGMYKDLKGQGVKFFAVNQQEDKDTVQKFVNDSKLSIPVLMDTDGSVCGRYDSAGAIPFTVVVGKDGKVIKAGFFGGAEDQLRPIIQSALKK